MKKILVKIISALCVMLAFSSNANAQWRFGLEANAGFNAKFNYDNVGFFEDKEAVGYGFYQVNFMSEYIMPRHWTPNWLALSVRAGMGFIQAEDDSFAGYQYSDDDDFSRGLDIPLEVEVRYLFTNKIRAYVNGGITPTIMMSGNEYSAYNDGEYQNYSWNTFNMGYQFGLGFEFGNFRIGYKNFSFSKTMCDSGMGNKVKPAHVLSLGFWFGGSRFLKKHSSLKVY